MSSSIDSPFDDKRFDQYFPNNRLTQDDIAKMRKYRGNDVFNAKPLSHKELVEELSDAVQIDEAIVRDILDALEQIYLREIVLKGSFRLKNIITVKSRMVKGRQVYNKDAGALVQMMDMPRLTATLPQKVREYYRWARRNEANKKDRKTVNNWYRDKIVQKMTEEEFLAITKPKPSK